MEDNTTGVAPDMQNNYKIKTIDKVIDEYKKNIFNFYD